MAAAAWPACTASSGTHRQLWDRKTCWTVVQFALCTAAAQRNLTRAAEQRLNVAPSVQQAPRSTRCDSTCFSCAVAAALCRRRRSPPSTGSCVCDCGRAVLAPVNALHAVPLRLCRETLDYHTGQHGGAGTRAAARAAQDEALAAARPQHQPAGGALALVGWGGWAADTGGGLGQARSSARDRVNGP